MRTDTVFSTSSLQAYLSLVVLCGIALGLSIQPAVTIAALRASDITYPPGLFHMSFVLIFGLFAINRGAIVAANISSRVSHLKLVLRFLEHIGYGLMLLLPFIIYSRALIPSGTAGLITLVAFTAIAAVFFCLISLRLELRGTHRRRGAFLLRYGCYLAFCLIPFGIGLSHPSLVLFVSASPIGFATRVIEGASASEIAIGFLVPVLGILWILTRRQRFDRRHHAV
ncbi:hypothetical protein KKG90_01000 [Candidatus Bipolaricaulota bacterium]|nr:hypothetical protein [Candidatus Bipolaricaulota bacterium]